MARKHIPGTRDSMSRGSGRTTSAHRSLSRPSGHLAKMLAIGLFLLAIFGVVLGAGPAAAQRGGDAPPLLFVTQPPFAADFATVNATFGNHNPRTDATPRGGDLYIRYADGTLRNLTAEAGFGLEAEREIAAREPSVHWSGTKALFSMVIGGTTQNDTSAVYWQIYEVSGFDRGEAVSIRKLAQPEEVNNVSPLYGTDDRILFTSDRTRAGDRLTYPQLDEYEATPTVSGIWSMAPDGSDLRQLDHAPSGAFTPIITSDGRILFTRWDHLQRDQQNFPGNQFGAFNFASETSAQQLTTAGESFPEQITPPAGSPVNGHTFNSFIPWQINEDGTGMETLNHVGRHELASYFAASHRGLPDFAAPEGRRTADRIFQIKEDPNRPGYFYGTFAPEFGTHAAGQIIGLAGGEAVNADDMQVDYVTDPMGQFPLDEGAPNNGHPGLFRSPTPLSDGSLVAVHSASPYYDEGSTSGALTSKYTFRLVRLRPGSPYADTGERLIPGGIVKSITYWDDQSFTQITYSGELWELDPVEVRARPRPAKHANPLHDIERAVLADELGGEAGIERLQSFLRDRDLALLVSRNMTRRADKQQEFNLKVAGSTTQTAEPGATPVEIAYLQFFEAKAIRGYEALTPGRRLLAQPMDTGLIPEVQDAPRGSVRVGSDGSMAAFLPASRALSWQLTGTDGTPVIRERYWLTFGRGEMRSCANCHGLNRTDIVLEMPTPTNPPEALRELARWYRANFEQGAGGPAISRAVGLANPFRVRIDGQNFDAAAQVFIGEDSAPWSSVKVKGSTRLILKGGQRLEERFPVGTPVAIRVRNGDGREATTTFTR
jgi:hypothetical protein